MKRKHKDRVKKLRKLRLIHDDTWALHAEYVKNRDNWTCVICGKQRPFDSFNMHASHYIHGNEYDFSEIVVNCNCKECHYLFAQETPAGMKTKEAYRVYLENKWSKNTIDNLIQQKYSYKKETREELYMIQEALKNKIGQLLASKSIEVLK